MVVLYPISVPLLYFVLLFKTRKLINGNQKEKEEEIGTANAAKEALEERVKHEEEHPSIKRLSFLYENYQPKFWWFEVFETLRKLSLTGFLVFCFPGTGIQVCVALVITTISLVVYELKPFNDSFANKLARIAQWQLFLTILCAFAIKTKMDGRELKDHRSFDVYLTCLQIIPVVLVTIYFLTKKILSSNSKNKQTRSSVLPNPVEDGEVIEAAEEIGKVDKEEEGGHEAKAEEQRVGELTSKATNVRFSPQLPTHNDRELERQSR